MRKELKKEKDFIKNVHLMNYHGKVKITNIYTYGSYVIKYIQKVVNGKTQTFSIKYEIRSHKISLPFDENLEVRQLLRKGKTIAKELLEQELDELIKKYIDITLKDIELNYCYTSQWNVLTKSDGSLYKDINNNVILVKYYRITPTNKFLEKTHTPEELAKMEKKKDN